MCPTDWQLWCRAALRVVFRRAEGGNTGQVLTKVYRLADRLAARLAKVPVERGTVENVAGAARELDAVIAWYDALIPPAPSRGPVGIGKVDAA